MSQQAKESTVVMQGKHLGDTMNAATRITMNANTILQQPDITLAELKNLPTHQSAARGHSNTWLKNVWPSIIDVTADIIDYANTFDSSYQSLLGLVDKLKSGDEGAKKEFIQVLNEILLPALKEKKTKAAKVASDTASLKDAFMGDFNNFEKDFGAAQKAYLSQHGTLTELQGKFKAAKAKAHSLEIALIATAAAAGALLVAAAVVDVLTEGAATPYLVGGAVAGEVADAVIAEQYSKAVEEMNKLQIQIKSIQNQLNYLNAVEKQIGGFEACISDTVTATQSVVDGWTGLTADLSEVIEQLNKITPQEAAILITVQLNTANKDWQIVLKQAKVLQPSGKIPVKNFKGMESFIKAISREQGA